jgi:hypothetical protein
VFTRPPFADNHYRCGCDKYNYWCTLSRVWTNIIFFSVAFWEFSLFRARGRVYVGIFACVCVCVCVYVCVCVCVCTSYSAPTAGERTYFAGKLLYCELIFKLYTKTLLIF